MGKAGFQSTCVQTNIQNRIVARLVLHFFQGIIEIFQDLWLFVDDEGGPWGIEQQTN